MKPLLPFVVFCLPYLVAAQRETFDLLSYSPPEGWVKESKEHIIAFTTTSPGTYCRIVIYESTPGSGNSQQDFKHEWDDLVVRNYKPDQPPLQVQEQRASEWSINAGTSTFQFKDQQSLVMLTTMSDAHTVISLLFLFNDESYVADIEKFMESVEIVKPPQSLSQPVTQTESLPSNHPPGLIGKWGKSSAVAVGTYASNITGTGYSKSVYNFKSDGSYTYKQRTFSSTNSKIIVVKESGAYSVAGNRITISPSKSVIESWDKKDGTDELGTLLTSEARKFETVTYQFTFHYFEGLGEWNLVMQADKETQRDGPFSANTTFTNAWYFDQKFVEAEMDAPRIHQLSAK